MARYKLAYLHPAEMDILGIVRFHAEQVGPASAREIYRSIREQIGRLQDFPMRCLLWKPAASTQRGISMPECPLWKWRKGWR